MTHKELVAVAYRWVLNSGKCGVAFKELVTNTCNSECPDVIGFASWGSSTLIECKVSRSDFLLDKKKLFRMYPDTGMGRYRFYCCPAGLIKVGELPIGWGLIYVSKVGRPRKILQGPSNEHNLRAEHGLMYSALRRLHLRGRIDEVYQPFESVIQ